MSEELKDYEIVYQYECGTLEKAIAKVLENRNIVSITLDKVVRQKNDAIYYKFEVKRLGE